MKWKFITLLVVLFVFATGCSNKEFKSSLDNGKKEIDSKNYEKAVAFFELALNEKKDSEETKTLLSQTNTMIEANKLQAESKFDEATKQYKAVEDLKNGSEKLVSQAKEQREIVAAKETFQSKLAQAEEQKNNKNYTESERILNTIVTETKDKDSFKEYNKKAVGMIAAIKEVTDKTIGRYLFNQGDVSISARNLKDNTNSAFRNYNKEVEIALISNVKKGGATEEAETFKISTKNIVLKTNDGKEYKNPQVNAEGGDYTLISGNNYFQYFFNIPKDVTNFDDASIVLVSDNGSEIGKTKIKTMKVSTLSEKEIAHRVLGVYFEQNSAEHKNYFSAGQSSNHPNDFTKGIIMYDVPNGGMAHNVCQYTIADNGDVTFTNMSDAPYKSQNPTGVSNIFNVSKTMLDSF